MLKRVRALLQQSWFVGILVALAIGISVRNIVLPLIELGSESGVKAVSVEGETLVETGGLIKRVSSDGSLAGGVPDHYPKLRSEFFARQSATDRNPFKISVPPKPVVLKSPLVTKASTQQSKPAMKLTQDLVGRLFSLQAVMASQTGQLALISREVVKEGDSLPVGHLANSTDSLIQQALTEGLIRYGTPFKVLEIHNKRVVISREQQQFELLLREQ